MSYPVQVLICILSGITMFLIDTTVVNVALAKFEAVFAVDVATVQWAITAYALASGMITPMANYFVDRWGMKRVWLAGLIGFTLASMLDGFAPGFPILILGRVLQGISGGLLLPIGISAIFRAFPPERRGVALGFFAIPLVAGPALGPTVGGYIVTNLDWRLIFFINLPVGILSVLLGMTLLRDEREPRTPTLDVIGAILASAAFGSILYGLSRVAEDGWGSLTVEGFTLVGAVCLILFIAYELEQQEPLLEVRLFAIPQFLIGNMVGWVSTVALFGAEFMLPLYLQNLRGLSALDTGILLLPQGLSTAMAGPIAGRLTDKFGVRAVATLGFILLAVNTWNLSQITLETGYGTIRLLLILRGVALGCTIQSSSLVALAAAPPRLTTSASSLQTAMRNVFQSFGVGLLGTLVQTQTAMHTTLLSQEVTANSPSGLFIAQMTAVMMQHTPGISHAAAQAQATLMMLGQVRQQAAVLAFGDGYRFTFFAALLAVGLSLFLPDRLARSNRPGGASAH